MEEEKKDENKKDDSNLQNNDRTEELNKNIYKQPSYEQNTENKENKENSEENNKNDIQEKEEKKEEIKEENNNINNDNLNNNKEIEPNKITELTNEIEKIKKEKQSFEEQNKELKEKNIKLNEENNKLTTKLKSLKESITKLKECLEKDIYAKLDSKTKLLKEALEEKESLQKQIYPLNEEIKKYKLMEEEFKQFREKFNSLIKEKSTQDNISMKQVEKMQMFEEEIELLNKQSEEKDERYKKLDEIYLSVIKVIDEHKKTILNLKKKIKAKEDEENNKKIILFQKEQEIALLRNFINSYKNDIKVRFKNKFYNNNTDNFYLKKDFPKLRTNRSDVDLLNNRRFQPKFSKDKNIINKNNLPKIDIKNINKKSENNINDNFNILKQKLNQEMDDKDEENIKEITNMMKNMIND